MLYSAILLIMGRSEPSQNAQPSQNSDYDVRFIYIRPEEWYLSIYAIQKVRLRGKQKLCGMKTQELQHSWVLHSSCRTGMPLYRHQLGTWCDSFGRLVFDKNRLQGDIRSNWADV